MKVPNILIKLMKVPLKTSNPNFIISGKLPHINAVIKAHIIP